ncbi:NAD(P)-binding domain-containing protein, partial [Mycobacterium sp. E136]|uniref:NAD(P)-binding domain-containing protein n=1 Tax=Mycobacterium sp. E136 TaxID=1834125 RepID=UPI0018D2E32C
MSESIGFIGAGQMGEPMVHRLLAAGRAVTVYARKPEVRQRLNDAGATVVDSIADVGTGSRVVICCMFSDAQLKDVATELIDHCAAGTV